MTDAINIRIKLGFTNCYLLPCDGGYLMVDTSYPGYEKVLLKYLEKEKIKPEQIKYILLTHHHDDHAGFAAEFKRISGARLIVHERAVSPLGFGRTQENITPVNKRIEFVFSLFKALLHSGFTYPPVVLDGNDIIIGGDDNELMRSIGIPGRIVQTPGHSSDSVSLLLDNGDAFVGDLAMNFLSLSGIRHRPIYIENLEQVFKSWKKIIALGAKKVYPSHGKSFHVERLVYHWKKQIG